MHYSLSNLTSWVIIQKWRVILLTYFCNVLLIFNNAQIKNEWLEHKQMDVRKDQYQSKRNRQKLRFITRI